MKEFEASEMVKIRRQLQPLDIQRSPAGPNNINNSIKPRQICVIIDTYDIWQFLLHSGYSNVVFSVKNTSIIEVDYCNFIGGSGCNFLSICENNLGYF